MIKLNSKIVCSVRIGAIVAALSVAPYTQAQYRLSVFDEAVAHDALKNNDISGAEAAFEKRTYRSMDYADLNNLCVLKIAERNTDEASDSCRKALKQIRHLSIRNREKRQTRAVVLSNLSVALALDGQIAAAEDAIREALVLDSDNKEAQVNYVAFSRAKFASR